MSRLVIGMALGIYALGAAGCAGAMHERVTKLEEQVSALQRDQALAAARIDESNRVSQNVYLLQDRVEQMALVLERAQSGAPEPEGEIPGEVPLLEDQPADDQPVEARPPTRTARPTPAAKAPAAPGDDPVTLYRKGYDLLKAADYAASARAFKILLERYPAHELADNALYWLGEVDYVQKSYRPALESFRKVAELYPSGNKVPDALLKMAYCQQELGDKAKAKKTLEDLVSRFPWSGPAKKAKERLQSLG